MEKHIEHEDGLAGRWLNDPTDGDGSFADGQSLAYRILFAEDAVGTFLSNEGMVGSRKLGGSCYQWVMEHLQEAGIGSYEVQGIILFVVLHDYIGVECQCRTSYDLVVRNKGGVTIL